MEIKYTAKAVSKAMGVTPQTVSRWIRQEGLKATSVNCRYYEIKQEDLREFIDNPPNLITKGIIVLIDRSVLEKLIGKPKRRRNYRRYWPSVKPIGWKLP